jgi:trimeric autotransporter adhesin
VRLLKLTGSPGGNITTASNILSLGDENIATANIQVDWTVASDARDKTDFTALDLGLDFVKALAPVTYKWDKRSKYGDKSAEDYDLNAQTPDGTHKEDWLDIGFKAQEVEALEIAAGYNKDNKTNLVSSHTDDGKQMGLQYSKFVPILVKAIQDQQAIIDSLTTRIEALES